LERQRFTRSGDYSLFNGRDSATSRYPLKEVELCVVIWDAKDVPNGDFEETCDMFVKGFFEGKDSLKTDIHFRSQDHKGSFNFRFKFRVTDDPMSSTTLTLQLWDKDLFSSSDYLAQGTVDLKQVIQDCFITKRAL